MFSGKVLLKPLCKIKTNTPNPSRVYKQAFATLFLEELYYNVPLSEIFYAKQERRENEFRLFTSEPPVEAVCDRHNNSLINELKYITVLPQSFTLKLSLENNGAKHMLLSKQ